MSKILGNNEYSDGSMDVEIELTDEERDVLVSKGVNYLMLESMFNTTFNEIMFILKEVKGMPNVIKDSGIEQEGSDPTA